MIVAAVRELRDTAAVPGLMDFLRLTMPTRARSRP